MDFAMLIYSLIPVAAFASGIIFHKAITRGPTPRPEVKESAPPDPALVEENARIAKQLENMLRYDGTGKGQRPIDED